jgi:hypothetical protein
MIQPKTALRYAEKLREYLEELNFYCNGTKDCKKCEYNKFSDDMCNTFNYNNFDSSVIAEQLDIIIADLTPKTGGTGNETRNA